MRIASVLSVLTIILTGNAIAASPMMTVKDANGVIIGPVINIYNYVTVPFIYKDKQIFLSFGRNGFDARWSLYYQSGNCSGDPISRYSPAPSQFEVGNLIGPPGKTLYILETPVPPGTQIYSYSEDTVDCRSLGSAPIVVGEEDSYYLAQPVVDLAERFTPPFTLVPDSTIVDLSKPLPKAK